MADENQLRRKPALRLLFVVCLVIGLGVVFGKFLTYRVESSSMQNSLFDGDWVLQNPLSRNFARGDIIVLRSPVDGKTLLTKRIIALGGDSLAICAGQLFLSGVPFTEPYAAHFDTYTPEKNWWPIDRADHPGACSTAGVVVPAYSVFVMGDNRDLSEDSRSFGSVTVASITGKARLVLWSSQNDSGPGPIPKALNGSRRAGDARRKRWLLASQAPAPQISSPAK